MNPTTLQEWLQLPESTKRNIFSTIADAMNLPSAAIEKDWWVVQTLSLVFATSIAPHTVFKGGTSLSKAWQLIDRFSEDIDLALDRSFLGFGANLNATQVRKLRQASARFISETFFPEIQQAFAQTGLEGVNIQLGPVQQSDQDPLIIEIHYPTLTDPVAYLQPRVLIEVGSRSLIEPFSFREVQSFVGGHYTGRTFADLPVNIPCVNPERTFLEKIFLLHEEFQQAPEKVRVERKSRHLYDLERLMDTEFAAKALADEQLYQAIVHHRRTITPLRGIDYSKHQPGLVDPLPPAYLLAAWEQDYNIMRQTMLYNNPASFQQLMTRLQSLKTRINTLTFEC